MQSSPQHPLLLVCAVKAELEPLADRLTEAATEPLLSVTAIRGRAGNTDVMAIATGIGKTNAAHALAVAMERRTPAGILSFGVAGAYPGSGIEPGSIALASGEAYGDEGSLSPTGWLSVKDLGFPLVDDGYRHLYDEFPIPASRVRAAETALRQLGQTVHVGRFLTVSSCSGTDARAAEMERRFGVIAETMEGAAHAHVAALRDLPFLEIRGISNVVENRDPARWDLPAAAHASAAAAELIAAHWTEIAP